MKGNSIASSARTYKCIYACAIYHFEFEFDSGLDRELARVSVHVLQFLLNSNRFGVEHSVYILVHAYKSKCVIADDHDGMASRPMYRSARVNEEDNIAC